MDAASTESTIFRPASPFPSSTSCRARTKSESRGSTRPATLSVRCADAWRAVTSARAVQRTIASRCVIGLAHPSSRHAALRARSACAAQRQRQRCENLFIGRETGLLQGGVGAQQCRERLIELGDRPRIHVTRPRADGVAPTSPGVARVGLLEQRVELVLEPAGRGAAVTPSTPPRQCQRLRAERHHHGDSRRFLLLEHVWNHLDSRYRITTRDGIEEISQRLSPPYADNRRNGALVDDAGFVPPPALTNAIAPSKTGELIELRPPLHQLVTHSILE